MTKSQRHNLDKLYQAVGVQKACVISGMKATVVHHFIGRRNKATRWYLPNAVPLTHEHHLHAHAHPLGFEKYMIQKRGYKWYDNLRKQANKIAKNIQYQNVIDHLSGKREHYL